VKPPAVVIAALSGASALIFENLWFRSASIALGSSASASAVVLAAFMAGIAIGSLAWLRLESHVRRPMHAYASIELTIAVSGLIVLVLLSRATTWLTPAFSELTTSSFALNGMRLAVSFGMLVVPAAAMGATLPVLMRAITGGSETFGGKLGRVYGANTLGAVAGTLGSELVLISWIGVLASGVVAATLNVVAAALSYRAGRLDVVESTAAAPGARRVKRFQPALRRWPLLVAGGLCGALFLGFEVATFRFLLLFFTALNVNFAVMLAVVLAGLALGGLAAGRWFRRRIAIEATLTASACLAGVALVLSYRLFPALLGAALSLSPLTAVAAATIAFVLPLSALSGFLFAAIGQALHKTGLRDSAAAGLLTAANTVGAAVGALVTGFVLIERLGLEQTFLAFAAGYGVVGLLVGAATTGPVAVALRRTQWTSAALFCGGLVLFPIGLMEEVFHRFPINRLSAAGETRVAFREGRGETLQYLRAESLGRPDYYRLVINNHSMAATDVRSRRYMRLFAHLPSVLHPRPESAVLLGVGLGVTAKALTEDSRFKSIDIVDISPDIPDMLPVVYPNPADNPLVDWRVQVHLEDGRFFLATTRRRFDVITAEPPPPHYAGVANLYSQEFFQLVADRLTPGGIATYWLPVHDLTVEEAQAIVAAFLSAFPEASLWTGSGLDWILMGLKPPGGGVSDEAFRAWWSTPPLGDRLREIGIDSPESLGALFLADGTRLREWVGTTRPVTDDFPRRISLATSRDASDAASFVRLMTDNDRPVNFASSPLIGSMWPASVRSASVSRFERQARIDALLSLPALDVGSLKRTLGPRPDPLLIKALFWRHHFDFDRADSLVRLDPGLQGEGLAEYRAQIALMKGRPSEAADWLSRTASPRARELQTIRAYSQSLAEDDSLPGQPSRWR
jgi:predicted membrane-bound spermidine synthase